MSVIPAAPGRAIYRDGGRYVRYHRFRYASALDAKLGTALCGRLGDVVEHVREREFNCRTCERLFASRVAKMERRAR